MRTTVAVLALALIAAPAIQAQQSTRRVGPVCIACRNAIGLRFNVRDKDLERADGMNVTVWTPHRPTTGTVNGVALGLLGTGGAYVNGLAIAPLALNASTKFTGIGVSGVAFGVGGNASGILLAGGGGGIGEDITGLAVTGIGMGIGGSATGILISGIGAGIGGGFRGLALAGIGFGVGGSGYGILASGLGSAVSGTMRGISAAGIGFGGGGSMHGITVAGLGAGVGGDVSGLTVAGLGMGVGGKARGITIGGLGIGATRLEGLVVAGAVGTSESRAIVIAPVYFRAKKQSGDAAVSGMSIAALNDIRGMQRGISVGIVNYARSLKGVQIGAVNIVADGKGPKILPIVNWR